MTPCRPRPPAPPADIIGSVTKFVLSGDERVAHYRDQMGEGPRICACHYLCVSAPLFIVPLLQLTLGPCATVAGKAGVVVPVADVTCLCRQRRQSCGFHQDARPPQREPAVPSACCCFHHSHRSRGCCRSCFPPIVAYPTPCTLLGPMLRVAPIYTHWPLAHHPLTHLPSTPCWPQDLHESMASHLKLHFNNEEHSDSQVGGGWGGWVGGGLNLLPAGRRMHPDLDTAQHRAAAACSSASAAWQPTQPLEVWV